MKRRRILTVIGGIAAVAVLVGSVITVATWPNVAELAVHPPVTTAFIDRYRAQRRAAGESVVVAWQWVSWEAISPHLKRAVVAAEDMEFFTHAGFSTTEIRAAVREAIERREAPRGASTITQQLAKNLWLSPSRSPLRKLREVVLTRQLERSLSKRRILALYLNVVEFGSGIYGAEAAARHYFGKPARLLTELEAAQLAASLPRPKSWHPGVASASYRRYVEEILRRMERATFLWKYVDASPDSFIPHEPPAIVLPDSISDLLAPESGGGDSGRIN